MRSRSVIISPPRATYRIGVPSPTTPSHRLASSLSVSSRPFLSRLSLVPPASFCILHLLLRLLVVVGVHTVARQKRAPQPNCSVNCESRERERENPLYRLYATLCASLSPRLHPTSRARNYSDCEGEKEDGEKKGGTGVPSVTDRVRQAVS